MLLQNDVPCLSYRNRGLERLEALQFLAWVCRLSSGDVGTQLLSAVTLGASPGEHGCQRILPYTHSVARAVFLISDRLKSSNAHKSGWFTLGWCPGLFSGLTSILGSGSASLHQSPDLKQLLWLRDLA